MYMKKLLLFFAVYLSLSASAQFSTPPYMRVSATGYWWDQPSAFSAGLHLPAFGDTALTAKQSQRAGAVLIDTVGANKGLYYWMDGHWNLVALSSTGGVDSLLFSTRGWRQKGIDSVMGIVNTKQAAGSYLTALTGDGTASGPGSSVFTLTNTGVLAGSYSIPNITVNSKGQVTDIASGPAIPAQFNPIAGTNMAFTGTYPNITFNASGGSGNPNRNIGAAFRLAVPNTNDIKTLSAGLYTAMDSAVTGQIGVKVDTATMFPQLRSTIPPAGGSGTVTSVATNSGTGLTGGPITSTGTLAIDTTSTIQKKLAFTPPLIKNNNTISLQGAADGPNYVYGKGPTNQWGMQRVFLFDSTSGPSDSGEVHFNKTSKQFYVTPISAGGGGSSASMGKMNFTIGGVGAPAAGDSVLTSTYLISKDIDVFLNGDLVDSSGLTTTSSYTFDNTTGAITFKLAGGPGFVTGDHVEIRAWPTANVYTIPMPPVWSSFAYETRTGGTLTKVGNVYTASSSGNWNHTGLSSTPFTGDGRIRMQVPNLTTDIFAVLGLDATNAEQDYSTIDAGVVVYGSGDVKKNEGGAQTSVGTITAGQYLCLYRVGSVIKIQKSSDGNTWVDFPTPAILTFSSSATLYNVTSVYNSGVLNDPQIKLE